MGGLGDSVESLSETLRGLYKFLSELASARFGRAEVFFLKIARASSL